MSQSSSKNSNGQVRDTAIPAATAHIQQDGLKNGQPESFYEQQSANEGKEKETQQQAPQEDQSTCTSNSTLVSGIKPSSEESPSLNGKMVHEMFQTKLPNLTDTNATISIVETHQPQSFPFLEACEETTAVSINSAIRTSKANRVFVDSPKYTTAKLETLLWSDEQYGSISYVYHDSQYETTHDNNRQLVMTYRAIFADPPEHNVEDFYYIDSVQISVKSFKEQYKDVVLPSMPLPPEYLVDCEGTIVRSVGFHAHSISLGMLENQPP